MKATTVVHEHEVITEHGDKLEIGVIRTNDDERAVAYCSLGKTTVAIFRGADGTVQIEIDDIAEEPVYMAVNLMALTAEPDDDDYRPWNMPEHREQWNVTDASARTFTRQ